MSTSSDKKWVWLLWVGGAIVVACVVLISLKEGYVQSESCAETGYVCCDNFDGIYSCEDQLDGMDHLPERVKILRDRLKRLQQNKDLNPSAYQRLQNAIDRYDNGEFKGLTLK